MRQTINQCAELDAGCRMPDAGARLCPLDQPQQAGEPSRPVQGIEPRSNGSGPAKLRLGTSFAPRLSDFGLPALLALTLALSTGCSSKDKLKVAQQKAFLAGQEQAWQQYRQVNPNSIRFLGPVANPIIAWREGLTLVRAIVEAGYAVPGNPSVIVVQRGAEQRQFSARQLLNGEDMELLPADQVILRP
jgi:hypothetical protein